MYKTSTKHQPIIKIMNYEDYWDQRDIISLVKQLTITIMIGSPSVIG